MRAYSAKTGSTTFLPSADWNIYGATYAGTGFLAFFLVPSIGIHQHLPLVIPGGVIDGANQLFTVTGRKFEVMVNGLAQQYTLTPTGFQLDRAPKPGDYLWCQVVV